MKGTTLRKANEAASELIVNHEMNWCRARLFHALAGAHEQDVLLPILKELFQDSVFEQSLFADLGVIDEYLDNMLENWRPR